ncbi:MAG: hypothetical protein QRY72_03250 [Candidatus Rhabdochlamydia sp.]
MNNSLEHSLNRRLKAMGLILCLFALIAAIWDLLPFQEEELSYLLLEEESPPSLNHYFVAGAFVFMGIISLLFYLKKKSELAQQTPSE